ncbi:MAG: hypothetical protein WAL75_07975 [Terracidiphilus sp.]
MSPTTASLQGSGTQAFTATIANDSAKPSAGVTWSIGTGAGALSASTSSSVTYTAPASISAATTVTLTATSVTSSAQSAFATITLSPPAAPTITAVTVSCAPTSVQTGLTSQCTPTVTGTGSFSSTVTWSVGNVAGGNSTVGTITSAGLYTAPATVPTTNPVTITATSTEDTTKSGPANVTITAPAAFTITSVAAACAPTSVETGDTSQCAATVTGTGAYSSAVAWSVGGVAGGNATVGTISSAGLYTAPATVPATNPVTITATSTADSTKSGTAQITVAAVAAEITITSLSESTANPFDPLTVTGTGFNDGTWAISVVFTPENGDPPLMIPVSSSSASSLQLMVPAFLAQTTGAFSAETVDVQVVAFSSTTTYLSNTITGLRVSALPAVAGTAPAGTVTVAALSAALNMSVNAQTLANGNSALTNISADMAQLNNDIYPLINAANTIIADPTQTVNLTAANGTTVVLTAQMLAQSDQYLQALMAAVVSQASIPTAASNTSCPAPTGDTAFDANLCNVQVYMQALAALGPSASFKLGSEMYGAAGSLSPMLTFTKPDAEAMAFFANLILGSLAEACDPVGGAVIYGIGGAPMVTTFIASLAEGGEVPSDTELAGEVGKGVLGAAADAGVPGISTAVDLVKTFVDVVAYQPPQKGILLSSGVATLLPGGITYLNPNTGAPTTLLQIPSTPDGGSFDTTSLVLAPGTTYTLTLSTNGTGGGTIASFPSVSSFPAGSSVAVTAVANSDSTFTGWGGACSGTGACAVTMNSNQSVSATFSSGVFDEVTPATVSLGTLGGCPGGTLTGSISLVTAPGVTWTTSLDNFATPPPDVTVTPTSGTGPGTVTVNVNYPPQAPDPGFTCSDTFSLFWGYGQVGFTLSDGSIIGSYVTFTTITVD